MIFPADFHRQSANGIFYFPPGEENLGFRLRTHRYLRL